MFEIKIKTRNAAFHNPDDSSLDKYETVAEVKRIVMEMLGKMEVGYTEGGCFDINGNKVGEWKLR